MDFDDDAAEEISDGGRHDEAAVLPKNKKRKQKRITHPEDSDDYEEVSETDENDSESDEHQDDRSPNAKNNVSHHRAASRHFDVTDQYDEDLDKSMQLKYKE